MPQRIIDAFSSLKFRDFRLLWLGQIITSMGLWMDQVTQGWLMYELTGSPFMLGLTGAFKGAPLLIFGVIAGVAADRYGRKSQLIVSIALNGVSNLLMVILVVTHWVQPWHILAVAALNGIAQAFQQPARQAMVSDIVDGHHLTNAIALNAVAYNCSRVVGPAIAGFVVAIVGVGGAYSFQLAIYIFAIIVTFQLSIPLLGYNSVKLEGRQRASILQDAWAGFEYIKSDRTILTLILLALVPTLFGMPYINLMPVFAKDVHKVGPEGLGILLGASGLGAITGAMLVAGNAGGGRRGKFLLLQTTTFGIALAAFAFSPWMAVVLPLLVVVGMTATGFNVLTNTLIQSHTPASLRGRVLGVYYLDRGLMPMGTLLAGAMAGFMGAPLTVAIMGGICSAFAIWVAIKVPRIRQFA